MSYAIGYFIYGATVPDNTMSAWDIDVFEFEGYLDQHYGNGDQATFTGVELYRIDEATDLSAKDVAEMISKLTPSQQAIDQFTAIQTRAAADPDLPQEIKDWIAQVTPVVFLTWGTS